MSKAQEPGPEVPLSTMPYPPLHEDKRFVVLSDWLVPFTVRPDGHPSLSPLLLCPREHTLTWLFPARRPGVSPYATPLVPISDSIRLVLMCCIACI